MTFNLLPCLVASSKSARFCLNHFCREPRRGKQRSFSIMSTRVGVIKIVIVINCNLITFFKIIENNCNSVFALITISEM